LLFKASPGKSLQDLISTNGWVWWYASVIPATVGSVNRRTVVQAGLGINRNPMPKITKAIWYELLMLIILVT
jgi:hypothetical protein